MATKGWGDWLAVLRWWRLCCSVLWRQRKDAEEMIHKRVWAVRIYCSGRRVVEAGGGVILGVGAMVRFEFLRYGRTVGPFLAQGSDFGGPPTILLYGMDMT